MSYTPLQLKRKFGLAKMEIRNVRKSVCKVRRGQYNNAMNKVPQEST
jgi:hypothetical protein